MTDAFIKLEKLTKVFPGHTEPAVDELDLCVREGEIVMLVGPSGCGKTTTMKMINRLVEPTSGRIVIDGQDVTGVNPDELRRRIGYVIQQGGLFPHLRVRDNVAAVLRLLGWPKARIDPRVDEMLELVGLDPSVYRDRYPKHLSGGQRQRVGVARALAADPPIMLMDEPFGAVDPIAREHLQNEFLRLQQEIRKTIVFVTHDITEAVKMGDRIAIVRDKSAVAQFDVPARVLASPADEFVRDFLGNNAELRALSLLEVSAHQFSPFPHVSMEPGTTQGDTAHRGPATVVLEDGRPVGWLIADEGPGRFLPVCPLSLGPQTMLSDALNQMVTEGTPAALLTDAAGQFAGCVEFTAVQRAVAGTSAGAAMDERPSEREVAGADGHA
ncbi:ABC transporter ATP-binding protein [Amycolatopsis sp. H20-H5]|uniref:ABC transporter ATP-binding protein n=1 Tax=Amycolatopsis sp. H20-H5 TaxID=3046309 RepID=UPI002DB6FA4F|nr:ATP-binding cassette domain-containing protein [Amycolatopsis sp. H20-H5]MEC3979057.1 ATP-binding cassette domain-containing protein [Amycolatopsis sp. H20-H5]